MFKYIFAFLVIAIAWAAAFILKERLPHGFNIAIAVTVLTVLVLVGLIAYRKYRARKAAREIEKALNAQAEEHARTVRPEQQAEVRAMQAEVTRAIASLKSSKLGKSGAEALYALPWYVIIGPPGSGKTTALRNSGLQFPYASQSGGGVKGVGGTRNCEWWLTNEAVLLDTAGRYMTADDDRDEWLAFLDMLRKNRPEKPLNGVIVAVSVADLLGAREHEIENMAKRVRERVDEVMGQLQMTMPIYLLFTKCDLVAGFSEFFGDLRKNERGQIWGFTWPLGEQLASPGASFGERFDELVKVADQRKFRRLAGEQKLEVREQVFQFPQQFAGVKQNLADFIENLFSANVYQGAPNFRGVYFTSGTQEGRPIDRLTQKLRDTLGLPQTAAPTQVVTEAKSFFLRDVFARVVFPDADIASRSPEEIRRQRRQRYLVAAGAFATALLILTIPAIAYVQNRDFVREAGVEVERIAANAGQPNAAPLTLAELEPVRARVEQLRKWETGAEFIPLYMRFGMYKGTEIYPQVSRLYSTALRRRVIEPLAARDLRAMREFVGRYPGEMVPTQAERTAQYDVLKTHILLSPATPRAAGEPETNAQKAFLTRTLVAAWGRGATPSGADLVAMNANVSAYIDQLQDRPADLALPRNVNAVRDVRGVLNRASNVGVALDGIIAAVAEMGFDVNLTRAIGRSPEHVFQVGPIPGRTVRGAFTRRGWEEYVRDRLNQAPEELVGEAWVLGQSPNIARADRLAETLADVRSQYFTQYIAEWQNFLASLRVREPGDPLTALQMLQWFTEGGTTAYQFLMRTVAENTRLLDPDAVAANAAGGSLLGAAQQIANARLQSQGRTGMAAGNAANAALAARNRQGGGLVDTRKRREDVENDPILRGIVEFGVPPTPVAPPAAAGAPPVPPPPPSPTALNTYQEQLQIVRDALQTHIDNPVAPTTPLITALTTAQTRVQSLINGAVVQSRPVLINLLPPPIEFTVQRATSALAGAGSDRWCSAVVVPYARTLHNRYPFAAGGQDAALSDVADFYRPTRGAVWAFYTEALTSDIARQGDQYDFVTRLGNDMADNWRPELRTFLNRSQDLSTVLFPAGSDAPRVDFEVRLRATPSIAELTFTVDGETLQYRNGPPEWRQFHWPGAGTQRGAKLRARGINGTDETIEQEGEWGLFRLFEAGVVRGSPEARIFSVVWRLRDQDIEVGVDIRPARSENPFFGVPRADNASTGRFLLPFRSEGVTAPHPIARRGRSCNLSGVPGMPSAPDEDSSSRRRRRRRHSGG
ncbi:MAG: type VI secretion system membrane subunit TssM [Deltaproteobacteria bacterium]|nr:type VI secretion system membrane subunit TssM [Myxococcales bacterium]MDP3213370.1 type VI secretion system membrane subunit TssM [Deltaproteobacteria bacterium]